MMNQGEVDAGPPNKKPKMGMAGGGAMLHANTNGYVTQMSETSSKFLSQSQKFKMTFQINDIYLIFSF